MYLTVVFNLYCIMLQRYVYLKLKSHIIQVITKRNQRIQTASNKLISFLETKDKNDILEEYSIIEKISYSMTTGADCVLCSNFPKANKTHQPPDIKSDSIKSGK